MLDYKVTKTFDYDITNNKFTQQQYIENLISMTLFVKGRANVNEVENPIYGNGYVGNVLYGKQNKIGSKLWLYTRQSSNTQSNTSDIQRIIYNDLRFLLTKNICRTLNIAVSKNAANIYIVITVDNLQPIKYSL
jgi:phage gp46-like protein